MRINKFVALATGISRRAADAAIDGGLVFVNGHVAQPGQQVSEEDHVTYNEQLLTAASKHITIMLNKPVGYVCSRDGQGSQTIYDLLPAELQHLVPIGRLDKNSSGLLLMTSDGQLAYELTHPKFQKNKIYEINLDKHLTDADKTAIERGVALDDGPSKLALKGSGKNWQVTMHEGRNRQIRRTFEAVGYKVTNLHRTEFGPYKLRNVASGKFDQLNI